MGRNSPQKGCGRVMGKRDNVADGMMEKKIFVNLREDFAYTTLK